MVDSKEIFNQINVQNGSTCAQMLRKYDKKILEIPEVVELLHYAGKDAVGMLFFLDTMKEDPKAFDKIPFNFESIPYFDDDLVEAFIEKATEIRKMEGIYPKSAKVAQEILETYKEKRRQKLAEIKGVLPEEIKETELFVPLKEEQEAYPDTLFIKHGNPSYVVFYLLNTMVSSEIEFKKKQGQGISERDLNSKTVREELSVSLQKFMGKYHYENGHVYRFNIERNGVYFMDGFVLKEGKVIEYDPKRYFQIDGLILDIQTKQIINLAGVDENVVTALKDKIKDKKLSIKEEKNTYVLMSGEKELLVAREGKSLPVFDLVARYKGKRYAEKARDNHILDVPNFLDIVEYAGPVLDDPIINYLKSLRTHIGMKVESDLDPLAHLFAAGYVPCYSRQLTDKYIKLVNERVPIKEGAPWNEKALVPMDIAIELANQYRKEKKDLLSKKRGCSVDMISDLDVLCVTSLEEQNMIKPYYRADEQICTLRSTTRFEEQYMINAVKRNINDIKREKFKIPKRDDEYGTSCISIQIPRAGGNIDIKNRYNHVVDACDKTFDANPENISKGLLSTLEREIPVQIIPGEAPVPYGCVLNGTNLFEYEDVVAGVYFSGDHYLLNGVIYELKDTINVSKNICLTKNGRFLLKKNDAVSDNLYSVLNRECKDKKITHKIDEAGLLNIYADGVFLGKVKDGEFVSLHLRETTSIGNAGIFNGNDYLEEFIAPNLLYIGSTLFCDTPNLKRIEIPNCIYAKQDFIGQSKKTDEPVKLPYINAPLVFEKGTNTPLKTKPITQMSAYNVAEFFKKEFKDKKVDMRLHNGFYQIFANGRKFVEITYTGEFWSINLQKTDLASLDHINLGYINSIVSPCSDKVNLHMLFTFNNLEKIDLPNCYCVFGNEYGSSCYREKINSLLKNAREVNMPHVYDKKNGIMMGSVFSWLDPKIRFNEEYEKIFNIHFMGKKITVEEDENNRYLFADGKKIATYDIKHEKIRKLELEKMPEFDLGLIDNEWFKLDELSLPDTKHIKPLNQSIKYIDFDFLSTVNMPQLETLGNKGIYFLDKINLKQININKDALKKEGVLFLESCIVDTKNQKIVGYDEEYSRFFELLNKDIEIEKFERHNVSNFYVKEEDGFTSIFINDREIATFEGKDVIRFDLPHIREIESSVIKNFPKLEEFKMENLVKMHELNVGDCPKLRKFHLPNLKEADWMCFTSLESCEEISLPSLEAVGSYSFDSINPNCSKISVPSLKNFSVKNSFHERYSFFTRIPIETNYFEEHNQKLFAGMVIDFNTNQVCSRQDRFSQMISEELKDAKIEIVEEEGIRYLKADGRTVLREENNAITGIYLAKADEISIPYGLDELREVEALRATKIKTCSCLLNHSLERFVADEVTEVEKECFSRCHNLKELSLKKLEKIDDESFYDLPKIQKLSFNHLKTCGKNCFSCLYNLENLQAVRLDKMGSGSLRGTDALVELNAPFLQKRLELLKKHPNRQQILKNMRKGRFFSHIMSAGALAK